MLIQDFLALGQSIYADTGARRPPDDGISSETHQIIPPAIVRDTRGYIEKISNQINGCYERGWFDACAVMMRRLLETLIIECFEHYKIGESIKKNDDFLYLRDLIGKTLSENSWTLSRNTRNALPKFKDLGDKSAHSRRYIAHRQDIDQIRSEFRGAVQEFIYLANLK